MIGKSSKKLGLLFVKSNSVNQLLQSQIHSLLKSYPQFQLEEVTHPKYSEFASMPAKDDIKVVVTVSNFTLINEVMKECKNIDWVHCYTTGCDKILSDEAFRKSPITITISRGISATGLSEFAIGAMLYFSRKFREWDRLQQQSTWSQLYATDISRKRVAIVGYGRIGSKIGKICKYGFEMSVVAVKNKLEESFKITNPEVDAVYKLDELGKAVEGADFVISVLPGGKETDDAFNLDVFKKMKKSAVFISIGRGSNVDEDALIFALKENMIAGAALDVFKTEPLPKTSPFYTDEELKEKIFITCHKANASEAVEEESVRFAKANLDAYLVGQPLDGLVDKSLGY